MAAGLKFTKNYVPSMLTQGGLLVLVGLLFLAVPYAPNGLILMSDNLIVRAVLIASCVGALYVEMLLGIFVFLFVARIFLERNNRKLLEAKAVINNNSLRLDVVLPDGGGEIVNTEASVDRVVYSPVDTGQDAEDYVSYLSNDDMGDSSFAPVDVSIDGKSVLPTTVEGSAASSTVFGDTHPGEDISNNAAP